MAIIIYVRVRALAKPRTSFFVLFYPACGRRANALKETDAHHKAAAAYVVPFRWPTEGKSPRCRILRIARAS